MEFFDRENTTLLVYSPKDVPPHVYKALTARHENVGPRLWFAATLLAAGTSLIVAWVMLSREVFGPTLPYIILFGGLAVSLALAIITGARQNRAVRIRKDRDDAFTGVYREKGLVRSSDPSYQYLMFVTDLRTGLQRINDAGALWVANYFGQTQVIIADQTIASGYNVRKSWARSLKEHEIIEIHFNTRKYLEGEARSTLALAISKPGRNLHVDQFVNQHFDELKRKRTTELEELRKITTFKLKVITQLQE